MDETRSLTSKISNRSKTSDYLDLENASSTGRKRGVSPRDLVRKLKQLGLNSNNTVVLRNNQQRPKCTFSGPISFGSSPSSEAESSPLSDQSFTEHESSRKSSVDSRLSVVTKDIFRGRNGRRNHP